MVSVREEITQALWVDGGDVAVHTWVFNVEAVVWGVLLEALPLLREDLLKRAVLAPHVLYLVLLPMAALVRLLQRADPGVGDEIAMVPQAVLVALNIELCEHGGSVILRSIWACEVRKVDLDLRRGLEYVENDGDVAGNRFGAAARGCVVALDREGIIS